MLVYGGKKKISRRKLRILLEIKSDNLGAYTSKPPKTVYLVESRIISSRCSFLGKPR